MGPVWRGGGRALAVLWPSPVPILVILDIPPRTVTEGRSPGEVYLPALSAALWPWVLAELARHRGGGTESPAGRGLSGAPSFAGASLFSSGGLGGPRRVGGP